MRSRAALFAGLLFFLNGYCLAQSPPSRLGASTHGLLLSEPPDLLHDFDRGIYDGDERTSARLTERPCIFQAETSPPQGESITPVISQGRAKLGLMAPASLLRACRELRQSVRPHQCSRVFIGGHNGTDSVGVLDLFYLHPRNAVDPARPDGLRELRAWRKRLLDLPTLPPNETRRRARDLIFDSNGPCYPGPLLQNGQDVGGQREATAAEKRTFEELLDCLAGLVDPSAKEGALVFSACGPLDDAGIAQRVDEIGVGQEVCGRLLSDAIGTRLFYSRGINGSPITRPVYDTSPFGHRVVVPSNWSEIRPR